VDRNADSGGSEVRFGSYVEHMASAFGQADRRTPFCSYCMGLILPGERKCNEPIAARLEPCRVEGAHQSLHHFVANAYWSQEGLATPASKSSSALRARSASVGPVDRLEFGGDRLAVLP
jgi:SRSO17 transposase